MSAETDKSDEIIDVEPQVITETPKDEKPKRASRSPVLLGAGLAVAGALAGGWIYRDFLADYLPNNQVQQLQARLDAADTANKESLKRIDAVVALTDELTSKLGASEAAAQQGLRSVAELKGRSDTAAADIGLLKQALDDATAQLADMKSKLGAAPSSSGTAVADPALAPRIEALEKDVASLKAAGPSNAPNMAALSQAMSDMKAKIAQGGAFAPEVERITRMVPAAEGLDVLGAEGEKGLPTSSQLAEQLKVIVAALPKETETANSGTGWYDSVTNFLGGLVTVKTIGSEDIAGVANKAAAFAASGELAQAIDALGPAEAALPASMQQWREMATRRLKLEQALEKTSAAVLRELAARG